MRKKLLHRLQLPRRARALSRYRRDRDGVLWVGGCSTVALARSTARRWSSTARRPSARGAGVAAGAPEATIVYGTKAFPNVAIMRLLAEEGIGADVSTLGELRFAQAAGPGAGSSSTATTSRTRSSPPPPRPTRGWSSWTSPARWSGRGGRREAGAPAGHAGHRGGQARGDPHRRTSARSSVLPPEEALGRSAARAAGLEVLGLHVHLGSQLLDSGARRGSAIEWLAEFGRARRDELDWTPAIVDLGGGLGIRYVADEPRAADAEYVGARSSATRASVAAARPRRSRSWCSSRAARWSAGGLHALPRRRGQASGGARRGSQSTAACPTTPGRALRRPLRGAVGEPGGRAAGGHVRRLRQALRVRRRADRARGAPGAASRRPTGGPGDRGVHARDGHQLQRGAAPGGRARRRPRREGRPAEVACLVDDERHGAVLQRDRRHDEHVEDLVVSEHARDRVGPPPRVHDCPDRVADGRRGLARPRPPRNGRRSAVGRGCRPSRGRFRRRRRSIWGPWTQTILAAIATAAPLQTTASTAVCQAPWENEQPEGRVGAGDQAEDSGVVDAAQPEPGARRPGEAVVEGAGREHGHDGAGEDGGGDLRVPTGRRQPERDSERDRRVERQLVEDASEPRLQRCNLRNAHRHTLARPAASRGWGATVSHPERVRFARRAPSLPVRDEGGFS